MKIHNAQKSKDGFTILETTRHSQQATMTLQPGEASSEKPNTHPGSDQTLIVLQGGSCPRKLAASPVK